MVGGARIVSSWGSEKDENDVHYREDTTSPNNARYSSHLVLHFDINETILVGDEIGGDSREDCLNKMIAKTAFCQLPLEFYNNTEQGSLIDGDIPKQRYQSVVPTHWWDGSPIHRLVETRINNTITGSNETDDEHGDHHCQPTTIPPLYTGWHWPPRTCPYYRTSFKPRAQNFIETDGTMYRTLYETLDQQLPGAVRTTTSKAPIARYQELMQSMIPAFFETLSELSTRHRSTTTQQSPSAKSSPPFTIVIRTFGMDLPDVARAISDFAHGRHPAYPEFSDPNLVLSEQHLFEGRWADRNGDFVYQLRQHGKIVADGDEQVLTMLHSCTICGIQDDYWFWKRNDYQPWAGKPVWALSPPASMSSKNVNTAKEDDAFNPNKEVYYHHILLDDNIHNLHDDSVACVREEVQQVIDSQKARSISFRTLTGKEIQAQHGLHLIRVPTIEPVLNSKWFLEQIANAQHQRFQKLTGQISK